MRHGNHTFKIGRTGSHKRCMVANMLKSLIEHERIETTVTKAKELRRHADRLITMAKKNTLASQRLAIAKLMVRYNKLTPKEARLCKKGDLSAYNTDRKVIGKLFGQLREQMATRPGGYTRIIRIGYQPSDDAEKCYIEFVK